MNLALVVLLLFSVASAVVINANSPNVFFSNELLAETFNELREIIDHSENGYQTYGKNTGQLRQFKAIYNADVDVQHQLNLNAILEFLDNEDMNTFLKSDRTRIYNALMRVLTALDNVLAEDAKSIETEDFNFLYYLLDYELVKDINVNTNIREVLWKLAFAPYYVGHGSAQRMGEHIGVASRIRRGYFDDPRMQSQHVHMAKSRGKVLAVSVHSYFSKRAAEFAESADIEFHFNHLLNEYKTTANLEKLDPKMLEQYFGLAAMFFVSNYQTEYYVRLFMTTIKNVNNIDDLTLEEDHFAVVDLASIPPLQDIPSKVLPKQQKYIFLSHVKDNGWEVSAQEMNTDNKERVIYFEGYYRESLLPFHFIDFAHLNSENRHKIAKVIENILTKKPGYLSLPYGDQIIENYLNPFLNQLREYDSKYTSLSEIIKDFSTLLVKVTLDSDPNFRAMSESLLTRPWTELEYYLLVKLYINNADAYTDLPNFLQSVEMLPVLSSFSQNYGVATALPAEESELIEEEVEVLQEITFDSDISDLDDYVEDDSNYDVSSSEFRPPPEELEESPNACPLLGSFKPSNHNEL